VGDFLGVAFEGGVDFAFGEGVELDRFVVAACEEEGGGRG